MVYYLSGTDRAVKQCPAEMRDQVKQFWSPSVHALTLYWGSLCFSHKSLICTSSGAEGEQAGSRVLGGSGRQEPTGKGAAGPGWDGLG